MEWSEGMRDGAGNFVVDQDGVSDGVVSFCYDGLALQQMETWRAK